jgi:predicted metalloprotease with PDZ domain
LRIGQWSPPRLTGRSALPGGRQKFLIHFAEELFHLVFMKGNQGWSVVFFICCFAATAAAQPAPVTLEVDASEAPRSWLHARLRIPAHPGALTLFYPKWIPGEHMPGGPVNNVTGLKFSAGGKPLDWRRDDVDMFAFHLDVPVGAGAVDVSLDFLLSAGGGTYSAGASSTANLLDLNWNQVLLYPRTDAPLQMPFAATLKLPEGWQFGTALPVAETHGNQIQFANAPLGTLVDSPVLAGKYFRTVALTPGEKVRHFIHLATDDPANFDALPPDTAHFPHTIQLVHEANALFGAHHYREYHFLLTASDHVPHFGLEHHECSDDRVSESWMTDGGTRTLSAELLPHEMVHSWNGKYRRPAGLATSDYQQPMHDELLWVYEGLTDYYGKVLAVRSGFLTNSDFCEAIALEAAELDHRAGRQWRPLADTAVAAQLLYASPDSGGGSRRKVDFYPEGDLIWLEADTIIRKQTNGEKSLDDFCKSFFGGKNSGPETAPYGYEDVIQSLNRIASHDWNKFFQDRIYEIAPRAPLGGIENAGWRLGYTNELPPLLKMREDVRKVTDMNYSLGFALDSDGNIGDVLPGSPADRAGICQGAKLIAVNSRAWSAKLLRDAVKSSVTNQAAIELLLNRNDYFQTAKVDYRGGEKYPVLERDSAKADLLEKIATPLHGRSANAQSAF